MTLVRYVTTTAGCKWYTINAQYFSLSKYQGFGLPHMAQKLASSVVGRLKKYRKLFDITCKSSDIDT